MSRTTKRLFVCNFGRFLGKLIIMSQCQFLEFNILKKDLIKVFDMSSVIAIILFGPTVNYNECLGVLFCF